MAKTKQKPSYNRHMWIPAPYGSVTRCKTCGATYLIGMSAICPKPENDGEETA